MLTGNLEEESVELEGIPKLHVTRYSYDGLGRETGTVNPNGTKTERELSWCTAGNKYYYKTVEKATGQNPVTRWFDVLGREVYTASKQGDVLMESASIFDEDGNKISEISFHPQKTSWTDYNYYPDGRMESQVTHTGRTVKYSYSGRRVTTDDNGRKSSQTLDSWGNVLTKTDPEETKITHRYNSNGQPVSTTVGSHTITMAYDDKGNQLKMVDPDIGEVSYTYDAYGRVKSYKSPKGSYSLVYDIRGRVMQKAYSSGRVVNYTYYESGKGISLLKSAQANNGTSDEYTYDEYGQLLKHTQKTDNQIFVYGYQYDDWGRMINQTSPNGYVQNYTYSDTDSHLMRVSDRNNSVLWQYVSNVPGIKQEYILGNRIVSTTTSSADETQRSIRYTKNGLPILGFDYRLDPLLGNVTSRSESYKSKTFTENFGYDDMDRLVSIEGSTEMYLNYDPNGNITGKSDVGYYEYEAGRPHAVTGIEVFSDELTTKPEQLITYTEFNKVETIKEGDYEMRFTYGPDEERVKSILYYKGALFRTVYYGDGFERKIDQSGRVNEYTYLGNDGSFGMVTRNVSTGVEITYYFHCDLLGSISAISNSMGNILEKRSYDAWGRQRNPLDWNDYANVPAMSITSLGYTFQEEMPEFGLINLNGRLYDPMLGRMLSPDPFIQDPENSQNYNRYSYCWNNPMKYTDPNGNFILSFFLPGIGSIIDAMLWSGLSYSIQARDKWSAGGFFDSMVNGGMYRGFSGMASGGIGDLLGHAAGNVGKELLRGGLHGVVGGILNVASGSSFLDGFASGAISSFMGSGLQALNVSNPFLLGAGGALSGGLSAALMGGNWGMAAFQGFMVGAFNHGQEDPPLKVTQVTIDDQVYYELSEVVVTATDLKVAQTISSAMISLAIRDLVIELKPYGPDQRIQIDCSGYMQSLNQRVGIKIPRVSTAQEEWFKRNAYYSTDPSQIQPGDQLFYSQPNHTGIAVEKDGKMGIIHATVRNRVKPALMFYPIDTEGRILNNNGNSRWKHIFKGFGRHL